MKVLVFLFVIASFTSVMAEESKKEDAVAVNTACSEEAKTASCGDDKVGTGLLKCIHGYKKEHKEFKISEGCHGSIKNLRANRKSKKQ